jgi:hypothetical protein
MREAASENQVGRARRRRRIRLTVVAIALGSLGSSCSARPSNPSAAGPNLDSTATYVADVRGDAVGGSLKSAADANLVALGRGACQMLDSAPPSQVEANMLAAASSTLTSGDAVAVIFHAGRDLCPNHSADVTGWTPTAAPSAASSAAVTLAPCVVAGDRCNSAGALPLAPLPAGKIVAGGSQTPVPWSAFSGDGTASGRVIPSGLEFRLANQGYDFLRAEVHGTYQNIRIDADVKPLTLPAGDRAGIGCEPVDGTVDYQFMIGPGATWFVRADPQSQALPQDIAGGRTSAVRPEVNHLSVACIGAGIGGSEIMFAINDVVVAHLRVPASTQGWLPLFGLCSCAGPAAADFTQLKEAAL